MLSVCKLRGEVHGPDTLDTLHFVKALDDPRGEVTTSWGTEAASLYILNFAANIAVTQSAENLWVETTQDLKPWVEIAWRQEPEDVYSSAPILWTAMRAQSTVL